MYYKSLSSLILLSVATACTILLSSCTQTVTDPASLVTAAPALPVAPMCTILATTVLDKLNPDGRVAFDGDIRVARGLNPNVGHLAAEFRGISGPRGNQSVGFTIDAYGISEAWLRNPFSAQVFRAQVHPAMRPVSGTFTPSGAFTGDYLGSAWSIQVQDATGTWSPVPRSTYSAFRANDIISPAAAAPTVPQLMPVGISNPQMFACAGERSQDDAVQTTWLIEVIAPNPALGRAGQVDFIQDLLNGDDRYVPNTSGPLQDPPDPPTPTIKGPGDPIRDGWVQCAMTQHEDDVATRELHMLAIHNGRLYHSLASKFEPATRDIGSTINRFSSISPWGDVGFVLGDGFGNIVSAALVAYPSRGISVFFVAESGGQYRLWHAVRYQPGGWRPADDVFALSGDGPIGTEHSWQVAAGLCPTFGASDWTVQNSDILVALWGGSNRTEVRMIQVVQDPREWRPGVTGIYSPRSNFVTFFSGVDPSRHPVLQNLVVTTRPFPDGPP